MPPRFMWGTGNYNTKTTGINELDGFQGLCTFVISAAFWKSK